MTLEFPQEAVRWSPLDELTGGEAWIAYSYGGEPLESARYLRPDSRHPARVQTERFGPTGGRRWTNSGWTGTQ
jgi:hypothetical protein